MSFAGSELVLSFCINIEIISAVFFRMADHRIHIVDIPALRRIGY